MHAFQNILSVEKCQPRVSEAVIFLLITDIIKDIGGTIRSRFIEFSGQEVLLQIGADGYEKVEGCRHHLCDAGVFLLKKYFEIMRTSFYLSNLPLYA